MALFLARQLCPVQEKQQGDGDVGEMTAALRGAPLFVPILFCSNARTAGAVTTGRATDSRNGSDRCPAARESAVGQRSEQAYSAATISALKSIPSALATPAP